MTDHKSYNLISKPYFLKPFWKQTNKKPPKNNTRSHPLFKNPWISWHAGFLSVKNSCVLTGYFHHRARIASTSIKSYECLQTCQSIFIPTLSHIPFHCLNTTGSLKSDPQLLTLSISLSIYPPNHHVPVPTLNLSFNPPTFLWQAPTHSTPLFLMYSLCQTLLPSSAHNSFIYKSAHFWKRLERLAKRLLLNPDSLSLYFKMKS